jgi:protoheme IX farnesyltransferase
MHQTLTVKGFKQLAVANSSWAFLTGLITIALYALVDCHGCQAITTQWSNLYLGSTAIGLLLAIAITGWSWYSYRQHHLLVIAATGMVAALFVQPILGLTLSSAMPHMVMLTFYLACTFFIATMAYSPAKPASNISIVSQQDRFYFRFLLTTGIAILLLLLTGVSIKMMNATLACPNWPLCQQTTTFSFDVPIILSLLHRISALIVGVLVAGIILQTQRNYSNNAQLVKWSNILALLYLAQIVIGALYIWVDLPNIITTLHLGLSVAMWSNLVILITVFYFAEKPYHTIETPVETAPLTRRERVTLYFKLIKPWILILLLLTTIAGMFIAARGLPSISLMLFTFIGGVLSAGGASVLNSYIDSDIDRQMSRTSRRATATGLIPPQNVLIFGLTLGALSIITFMVFINPLATFLSTLGFVYYVFFYTLYLKRNTIHNIVVGGAAGAIPPLVGWAAVTGTLNLEALYLFAIIFFWTPPHTWALALLVEKDYARVKVPMLPVVVGEKETAHQTFLYTVLLIAITLLPFSFHMVSWLYLITAIILGGEFLHLAWNLLQDYNKATSKKLYKYSQRYLALLFLVMAIDRLIF